MATAAEASDAELLERFVRQRDLSAFDGLLKRHGPMVYQVCQRVVQHPQDAEDAFQATFVVLVKKAASLDRPDQVAGWLHGVARRIALKVRGQSFQRQAREKPLPAEPLAGVDETNPEQIWRELRPILDEEIERL
ncbi:MAG: RNA polymerase sigma factor, partial [Gemmataceae bacterium]